MQSTEWRLGQTSERYETGGRGAGTISTGRGDNGGASYGTYQLSSRMGTLAEYLAESSYGDQFRGLTPVTPAFDRRWRELAAADPGFARDQHEFIKRSHYDVQHERLRAAGLDLSERGPAVQDAVWSTSVQFRNLTPRIVSRGLEERFGAGYRLDDLSDRQIVEAIQDYKIAHNQQLFSRSPTLWPGLLDRARSEREALIELASPDRAREVGATPEAEARGPAGRTLEMGDHGARVRTVQEYLVRLGYGDADGREVVVDGDFGRRTQQAVERFQRDSGRDVDGIVGPRTLAALERGEQQPLLSNPAHPDHGLYRQALRGIEQLPAGTFRSDVERSNAAATLAFEARISGASRIDHVVLGQRGDGLFAVQGALGDPAHLRVYADRIQAAGQPIERSTALLRDESQIGRAGIDPGPVVTRAPTVDPSGAPSGMRL
ncbi:VgrG-related protein [Cognatilysobacter tabacisoli]|uniref:VgrG-related protein n=1 Tax=Cognatilysobacter tabacisoli TaxID=2315424 RepID=UPI000E6AFF20|nr:XVIPCD domain-containing protein [Lysobacter tabacisoli]